MTAPARPADTRDTLVHAVCCDANVGLCGTGLTGGDRYTDDAVASCPLCVIAEQLGLPCATPGCEIGLDAVLAQLADLAPLGRCAVCGCTDDDACPGGCRWVADDLCSACAPGREG